jgi:alkanesulfonate monooxygenase SsuD/methylene tetrahydromethanopterin reductase-like flavin-dependent oxidoreductase (luciferase family)
MLESRKGLAATRVSFNDLVARGNIIVGSPATVRERIEAVHAKTGFKIMVPMTQFGTLPDELVKKSTQMFAEEVAPKLRPL